MSTVTNLVTGVIRRDSDSLVLLLQVDGSKPSVAAKDIAVADVRVLRAVCDPEVRAAPLVQDLPDGGVEVLLHVGEEGVLEEASPLSDRKEHVPRTLRPSAAAALDLGRRRLHLVLNGSHFEC